MDKNNSPEQGLFSQSLVHSSPVKDHPLAKADERFKSMYYDFLYVTAKYENNDTENQLQFIKRIMDGTNAVTVISDHIRNSGEITPEKAAEFVHTCISLHLENIFFVDCLLISCSTGSLSKKQVDYLSEVAAALKLGKSTVNLLCEYARAILEQSTEKYEKVNRTDTTDLYIHILCYTKKFVCGALADTDKSLHFYSMIHEKLDPKKILIISESASYNSCEIFKNNIIFENIMVDLTNMTQIHDFHIGFNCSKKIIFRNCDFINGGSLRFHGCEQLEIDECSFINFSNDAVLDLNHDCDVSVTKTIFKNCGYETGFTSTTGGIIRSTNMNHIVFRNCEFNGCFSKGNFKGGIVSFNNNVEAYDCKFNGCTNGTFLFYSDNGSFKGDNNVITDSVELKG